MENLKSYLLENLEELKGVVEEINGYNGALDYLQVYDNDEFTINELFSNPWEVLTSVYYGYYNIYDALIKFDGNGNIESLSDSEYKVDLQRALDDIIEELMKIYNKIDISDKIHELIKKML